jgi:hypothetical protein
MVALWMGLAPGVCSATSAWPLSWYAVRLSASCERTAVLRSTPIKIWAERGGKEGV